MGIGDGQSEPTEYARIVASTRSRIELAANECLGGKKRGKQEQIGGGRVVKGHT